MLTVLIGTLVSPLVALSVAWLLADSFGEDVPQTRLEWVMYNGPIIAVGALAISSVFV